MDLIRRLKHTAKKYKTLSELDILIYRDKIIWYLSETDEHYNGNEFTEDQTIQDFIKNGPPSFASDITDEIISEINNTIKTG